MRRMLMLSAILFALSSAVRAQQTAKRFETAGLVTGFGHSFRDYEQYKVLFIAGDFSRSFNRPGKNDFVSLYLEPQFNTIKTVHGLDMEFGSNIGFRNYVKINPRLYFYQMLGSGPHYISAKLVHQASGFIFSDNLFAGILARIDHQNFFNFQFGIRHISNAALKKPNKGMNTFNIRIGFSRRR